MQIYQLLLPYRLLIGKKDLKKENVDTEYKTIMYLTRYYGLYYILKYT